MNDRDWLLEFLERRIIRIKVQLHWSYIAFSGHWHQQDGLEKYTIAQGVWIYTCVSMLIFIHLFICLLYEPFYISNLHGSVVRGLRSESQGNELNSKTRLWVYFLNKTLYYLHCTSSPSSRYDLQLLWCWTVLAFNCVLVTWQFSKRDQ